MAEFVRRQKVHPYFNVENLIIDSYARSIGSTALAVYVYMCRRAGGDPNCWAEMGSVAKTLGLGASTVRDAIVRLELVGLVAVAEQYDEEGQRCNAYTLLEVDPGGPPAEWSGGFPSDAKVYRNAPRPVREVLDVPLWTVARKPTPRQNLAGGPPKSGGGGTKSWRGGRQELAGLPIPRRKLIEERSDTPIDENCADEIRDDGPEIEVRNAAAEKLGRALANIKLACAVPEHLRLSGSELEVLAVSPLYRRDVERYRKGVGA